MSGFSAASCSTDKSKPMDIIYACKHIGYDYLYHFLMRPFVNFDRYYYQHATTVFTLNNVWFLVNLRVLQINLSIWI